MLIVAMKHLPFVKVGKRGGQKRWIKEEDKRGGTWTTSSHLYVGVQDN